MIGISKVLNMCFLYSTHSLSHCILQSFFLILISSRIHHINRGKINRSLQVKFPPEIGCGLCSTNEVRFRYSEESLLRRCWFSEKKMKFFFYWTYKVSTLNCKQFLLQCFFFPVGRHCNSCYHHLANLRLIENLD